MPDSEQSRIEENRKLRIDKALSTPEIDVSFGTYEKELGFDRAELMGKLVAG